MAQQESLGDIQRQIEALRKKAEEIKQKDRPGIIAKIKEAIVAYDIEPHHLYENLTASVGESQTGRGESGETESREPKYRDANGNVWGGMGPRPKWLRAALNDGKQLEDFLVKPEAVTTTDGPIAGLPVAAQPAAAPAAAKPQEQPKPKAAAKKAATRRTKAAPRETSTPTAGTAGGEGASTVAYRHGTNTWSGRGRRPQWLTDLLNRGQKLDQYRV